MSVERTHNMSHQTRYALQGDAGLACVLTYTSRLVRGWPMMTPARYSWRHRARPNMFPYIWFPYRPP
jgi:hypothetical protein